MPVQEQVYGFFMPSETLIGIGAAKSVPAKLQSLGAKCPLIVTDKGVVATGIAKQITDLLDAAGLKYTIFDETVPNPTDKNVHDGVEVYKKNGCDSLITLGGGSPHDCGKGIALVVVNGGRIHDYEGLDKSSKPLMPYLAINTTAGTASEMTRFTIITDTSRHVKMAIVDWRVTPTIAINDPMLMVGMPPALTAATGMDALTHAVEAFVSTAATPMTDSAAIQTFKLIGKYLRKAVANGGDIEARDAMCYAEYLAGMAFNNASLGYVHAMAHQLGGFYDLPHGACNAVLLPHVCRFNITARVEKFAELATYLGQDITGYSPRDAAELAIEAIQQLSTDVGIPAGLVALGKVYGKDVKASDIPTMTANAQKDVCGLTNPRRATDAEISAIYTAAL
jgi:alcohol dehydrogenase